MCQKAILISSFTRLAYVLINSALNYIFNYCYVDLTMNFLLYQSFFFPKNIIEVFKNIFCNMKRYTYKHIVFKKNHIQ